jgi:hypothetical protein
LDRLGAQLSADRVEEHIALFSVSFEQSHLDESMFPESLVNCG